jgi:hypothetical protein
MGLPRLRTFAGTDLGAVSRLAAESDGSDGQQMDGHLKNRPHCMGLPALHGVAPLAWGYPAYVGLPCLRGVTTTTIFQEANSTAFHRTIFSPASTLNATDSRMNLG